MMNEKKIPSMVIGMGVSKPLLPSSKLLLRMSLAGRGGREKITHVQPPSPKNRITPMDVLRELTFLHSILEWYARYFFLIQPKLRKGYTVITDRYMYDFLIVDRLLSRSTWFKRLMVKIIPKPDVLACLFHDSQTILERKNDNTKEETIRQTELFFSLEPYVPSMAKIKTDTSIKQIAKIILEKIGKLS
jgi:thymidylate kinase